MVQLSEDQDLPFVSKSASLASSRNSTVLECNYEDCCPPLYEAIESAASDVDFARILHFFETGKWEGSLFSRPPFSLNPTPADQAKTWVTRFDTDDNDKVLWSQLPLHLAIVCSAPTKIIQRLVELYPQALRCTDDQHMLPLHLALRQNANDAVLALLVKEFPEAVNTKGKNGRTAVESALRAKDTNRGILLDAFVERTKSRLSASVIQEREYLKAMDTAKDNDVIAVKSKLEAQYAVVEKLRGDLAKTKGQLAQAKSDNVAMETNLLDQARDFELRNAELSDEYNLISKKNDGAKFFETFELQKRIDELENEKSNLECSRSSTREEEIRLKMELEMIQEKICKAKGVNDWSVLKQEMESLRAKRLQSDRSDTKSEIESLKLELQKTWEDETSQGRNSTNEKSDIKAELRLIKKSVDCLQADEVTVNSSADLYVLRDKVKNLQDRLTSRSAKNKIKQDLRVIQKFFENEIFEDEGKTKEEHTALQNALKKSSEKYYAERSIAELTTLKSDLLFMQKNIISKKLEKSTKKEIDELRSFVQITRDCSVDPKDTTELSVLHDRIKTMHASVQENPSNEQLVALRAEATLLSDKVKAIEISAKIHVEADSLRKTVNEELEKSQGKSQEELMQIKNARKSLLDSEQTKTDAVGLTKIRSNLGTVKQDFKAIEQASKTKVELSVLKKALEIQIHNLHGKTEKELAEMRKAVNAINLKNKESKKLKDNLTEEIKISNGKAEDELRAIQKALDSMNLSKIQSSSLDEWNAVRKDLESMKIALSEKEVVELSPVELELRAMKKVVEAVNVKAIERINNAQFSMIRKDMEELKTELEQNDHCEAALKKAIRDLKDMAQTDVQKSPKKDKSGLKKFLLRRFNRNHCEDGNKDLEYCGSSIATNDRSFRDTPVYEFSAILPPSMYKKNQSFETIEEKTSLVHALRSKEETLATPRAGNTLKMLNGGATAIEPYAMHRTMSKTHVKDNGEVELEMIMPIPSYDE